MSGLTFLDNSHVNRTFYYSESKGVYFLFYSNYSDGLAMYQTCFASLSDLLNFFYSLTTVNLSRPASPVLKLVVAIIQKAGVTLYQAIEKAKSVLKLKKRMRTGKANFSFRKVSDQSERNATGTTDQNLIPTEKLPTGKGANRKDNILQVRFFDLVKMDWRSFNALSFMY